MVHETVQLAREKKKTLPLPVLPKLPKSIASTLKPDRKEVIKNQNSRFGNPK